VPPARMMWAFPQRTPSTAWITDCSPDPQTRVTVSAGTSTGTPALIAACRATFIPTPAWSTHPITTSSRSPADTFARSSACRMTTAPRSAAERSFSAPPNDPIGVRHALTSTASMSLAKGPHLVRNDEFHAGCRLHALSCRARGDLPEDKSLRRDFDDGHLGDDQVDDLQAGKRQRATLQDLMTPVPGRVFHRDDDLLCTGDEIHGAAHSLDHLAGNHPIGEVARLVNLQRAEHSQVDVAAAHHRKRIGAAEV